MKGEAPAQSHSDLQHPHVAEELAFLRGNFHDLVAAYAGQIEAEIAALVESVRSDAQSPRHPSSRAHDLRDMLSILQSLDVKPAKGRRRDLKKVEGVLEELRRVVERWS